MIENINETFGIKGKVRLDGFDEDSNAANDGKDALDQGGGGNMLDNKDIAKCIKRQHFMERNFSLLHEAIIQYREEGDLEEDPAEMLSVLEYITQNKMRDAVAQQNFLCKKQIVELKEEMNSKSEYIFKLKGKNYDLWKPSKLTMNRQMVEVIEKTT